MVDDAMTDATAMPVHLFTVYPRGHAHAGDLGGVTPLHEESGSGWESYTAMRAYFQAHPCDAQAWYGFFLPGFAAQSGLGMEDVRTFMHDYPGADAYTFFPYATEAAAYLNVFEQGDACEDGLMSLAQQYLDHLGLALDVTTWITHTQTSVRVNYVVAKPAFWTIWFDLAEKLVAMAGEGTTPFAHAANARIRSGTCTMKSLLVERLASLVLALDPELTLAAFDPLDMPVWHNMGAEDKAAMTALGALKAACITAHDEGRLAQFYAIRNQVLTRSILPDDVPLRAVDPAFVPSLISPSVSAPAPATLYGQDLFYGCITHVPLPVAFPDYVTPFYLGQSQGPGRLNLEELAPQWVPYHPIIGGMAGNFALKNYVLAQHPGARRIGVCMYRKFISRQRISGVPAEDNWMMDVITASDLQQQSLGQMMAPGDVPFLVGKTCGFTVGGKEAGYLLHYLHAHHGEDLLRFTAAAVELGVLDKAEIDLFFNEKVFLIGGIELGVFPADFWLETVSAIEQIVWHCVQTFPTHREGYQKRAWAFCAERLGSYLLLKHLDTHYRHQGGHGHFAGQLNLITQDDTVRYVPSH